MQKIGIIKEITPLETRVAATPETVIKLKKLDLEIYIERGAGIHSYISDHDYQTAGATIVNDATSVCEAVDIVLKVNPPIFDAEKNIREIDLLKNDSMLIAPIFPAQNKELVQQLNDKKITAFALDKMPRIARAQSMDILSSMSNIAGYKAVLMAADHLPKLFPMMTTAAGTILPAKVIVIGAGVAGLQAIATARRLGAVVLAFDTRPIVEEQVKSLGADFVSLETSHEKSQDMQGYAKAQTAEFYRKEQDILNKYLPDADVVITTALIPGQKPPILLTETMVRNMKPGSVIVDLAASQGGNCELTQVGEIIQIQKITIIGTLNLMSLLPIHASQLFSKNILSFLQYILPQIGQFDMEDDIIKNTLISHQGKIYAV